MLASNAVVEETANFIDRGSNEQRIQSICEHAEVFDTFIVHADATRTALPRIRTTIVDAIREGVSAKCQISVDRVIGLITVSEMESWALVSPRALAECLGFEAWPDRLRLHWNPAEVEALTDPKRTLEIAFEGLLGRPLGQELLHETLEALASRVSLEDLSSLPSYRRFREDLKICLTSLRAAR
jgi:hypothetical protein